MYFWFTVHLSTSIHLTSTEKFHPSPDSWQASNDRLTRRKHPWSDSMKFQFSNPFNPPPAPPGFGSGKILPEKSAPLVSDCFYLQNMILNERCIQDYFEAYLPLAFAFSRGWILQTPRTRWHVNYLSIVNILMMVSADFWELPEPQLTSTLTDNIEKNFYSRCPPEKRPRFMTREMSAGAQNEELGYEPDLEMVCRSHIVRSCESWTSGHPTDTKLA